MYISTKVLFKVKSSLLMQHAKVYHCCQGGTYLIKVAIYSDYTLMI